MLSKMGVLFRKRRKNALYAQIEERHSHWEVEKLTAANSKLRLDLHNARMRSAKLKRQVAMYDLLFAHIQSRVGHAAIDNLEQDDPSQPPSPLVSPKTDSSPQWIGDLWICSDSDYLKAAENYWKDGDPHTALTIVDNAIHTNPFLSVVEELHCRVFAAAALHATGRYETSNAHLQRVLQTISIGPEPSYRPYRDIMGIAYYIEGRNFLELEEFDKAFWSLSRALKTQTRGYEIKAGEFQTKTIEDFTRKEACEDAAPDAGSLRLISRNKENLD
ncbi:uncharacterized protein N7482_006760 [Penicillium canariense]|uniref:Uncharacterized protein n=1 Tax=Penicillium canariense TaxID=189055 RepID=A0A9W9HY66_9EURO|nr:uncharacterized protein N7482_006760 [Penicillium canariense]KAJ5159756.1 hypothetical protein N7482_006760 [Penicillium canariense]